MGIAIHVYCAFNDIFVSQECRYVNFIQTLSKTCFQNNVSTEIKKRIRDGFIA